MACLARYAAPVPRSAILVTLAVALTGCTNADVASLTEIKAKVCACKTASCAEQELGRVPQGAIKSTAKARELSRGMIECLARLEAAERPATDPDAEGSGSGDDESAPAPGPSAPRTASPGAAAPGATR